MSRYVRKSHGLIIGSGNIFFYHDGEELKEFPCILNFEGYAPKFFSFLHLNMHPPAVQLFWEHQKLPVISTCLTDREWTTYAKPNHFFTRFLDENCPGGAYVLISTPEAVFQTIRSFSPSARTLS